jgi:hypothetical protein
MASVLTSITVKDFLAQIENIMAHHHSLNWRAPIHGDDRGTIKLIIDVIEYDKGLGNGVESIILDLIHVDHSAQRSPYSIKTLKDKLVSIVATHSEYEELPILLGLHPEVADISGLGVRDLEMSSGSAKGIIVLEAQGE